MRILTLCYEFPPLGGGGARVVSELAPELVEAGHDVDVVTMGSRGLPRTETLHGVRVHRVPCIRRRPHYCTTPEAATYLIGALPVIRRLLAARRYDVTHAHFIFPDGLLAWSIKRKAGVPYVITAHGSDVPGYNPDRLEFTHGLLSPLWKWVTGGAASIVCPSNSLRSLVEAQGPEAPIAEIPNGIHPDKYRPDRPKSRRILVATRMLERKGVQFLLDALDGLELEHEVHLAGDGPYLPTLREKAERMRLPVVFHGWMDNASSEFGHLHESSDIYVLPSESENFPIGLLEAMTAGMAVITTSGTGCEEVVGDAALLVPPRDSGALRVALKRLVDDPELTARLGRAARQRVESRFSWSTVGARYSDLLEAVAQTPAEAGVRAEEGVPAEDGVPAGEGAPARTDGSAEAGRSARTGRSGRTDRSGRTGRSAGAGFTPPPVSAASARELDP